MYSPLETIPPDFSVGRGRGVSNGALNKPDLEFGHTTRDDPQMGLIALTSGMELKMTISAPKDWPLPNRDLLTTQWYLQQVTYLTGGTETDSDTEWSDDEEGVANPVKAGDEQPTAPPSTTKQADEDESSKNNGKKPSGSVGPQTIFEAPAWFDDDLDTIFGRSL
jgi:hypothetical protein